MLWLWGAFLGEDASTPPRDEALRKARAAAFEAKEQLAAKDQQIALMAAKLKAAEEELLRLRSDQLNLSHAFFMQSYDGHCGMTSGANFESDPAACARAERGVLIELPPNVQTWGAAAFLCAAHCRKCSRCRWFSVSLHHRDCSWYARCPRREAQPGGFRSASIRNLNDLGAEATLTYETLRTTSQGRAKTERQLTITAQMRRDTDDHRFVRNGTQARTRMPALSASRGYCEPSSPGRFDCERDTKGSISSVYDVPDLEACARLCRSCTRCRYVSFTPRNKTCSWFHTCNTSALEQGSDQQRAQHGSYQTMYVQKASLTPPACPFRVLVQTAAQFAGGTTGGPECLVNLAIALGANLPPGCTSIFAGNRLPTDELRRDYPDFERLSAHGVEGAEELLLQRGDMLVLPETDDCPARLVERGVRVWIYQLGLVSACNRLRRGCRFFAHNYWLSERAGLRVPRAMVVRPPLNPTHLASRHQFMRPHLRRSHRVLINGHGMPKRAVAAVLAACQRVNTSSLVKDVACEVPRDYSKPELRQLMGDTRIVVAWCMRGSERLPLEGAVYGALVLTNDCGVGTDSRDFPLPRHHVLHTAEAMAVMVETLLSSDSEYERALAAQRPLRELYLHGTSPRSMAREAAAFLDAAGRPQPAEELGGCDSTKRSGV